MQELTNCQLDDTNNMLSDLMQLGERVNIIEIERRGMDALEQGMSLAEEFASSVSLAKDVGGIPIDNCSITMHMPSDDPTTPPLCEFLPEGNFSSPHLNYCDEVTENERQAESDANDSNFLDDRLITVPSDDPGNFSPGADFSSSHLDRYNEERKEEECEAETALNKSNDYSITTPSDGLPPGDVSPGAKRFLSDLDRNEHINSHTGNLQHDVSVAEHLSNDEVHFQSNFPPRESFRSSAPLSTSSYRLNASPSFPRHVFKDISIDISYSLQWRRHVLFALLSGIVVLTCVLNYPFAAGGVLDSYWDNLPSDVRRQRLYRCCVDH